MTDTVSSIKKHRLQSHHIPARPLRLRQDHFHEQGEVQINIVPLIDVIFCILTFFILGAVGLSRQQAISLDLPKASTGTPQMREMLVVSLDDFGQLYVEKQLVTPNQLKDAIKNYHQYNPRGLMVLHASRNSSYNDVVQVLDMLQQAGGNRVALATLPGDSREENPNLNQPSVNTLPQESLNQLPQLPSNSTQSTESPTSPLLPGLPSNNSTGGQTKGSN